MLKNYLLIALRVFRRQSLYAGINVAGLAIGIFSFLFLGLYVLSELSFDRYHSKADRIFRITEDILQNGVGERSASLPFPTAEALKTDYPSQVLETVRFFNLQAPSLLLAYKEEDASYNETRIYFADSSLFKVFDFPLAVGDKETALDETNSILITRSMATKYFKEEDPMGKTMVLEGKHALKVTGVLDDTPYASHFKYDFLVSFSTLQQLVAKGNFIQWYWNPCWTYVLLREASDRSYLESRFPEFISKYFPAIIKDEVKLQFQPLTEIHLSSDLDYEMEPNNKLSNVKILSAVAVLVLFIACLNFVNLSTARAAKRAKEVGLRKILGSRRRQLMNQFVLESVFITTLSLMLGFILYTMAGAAFKSITGIGVPLASNYILALIAAGFVLLSGVLSGIYPAIVLSSFNPLNVLKNNYVLRGGNSLFRKTLVLTQFVISIVLIIVTLSAIHQINFMINRDLGFDKRQVIMIPASRSEIGDHYEAFRNDIVTYAEVKTMTAVGEIIGAKNQGANFQFEGMGESKLFPWIIVRHDFLSTFGLTLIAGRDFSRDAEFDNKESIIINENLARQQGWTAQEAVGKSAKIPGGGRLVDGKIIGVVRDFNSSSLHHPIGPLVLDLETSPGSFKGFMKYVAIKVDSKKVDETIDKLHKTWKNHVSNKEFEYFFLDDNLKSLYADEQEGGVLLTYFSGVAIFIACLGLFGLTSFTAEQRRKEISIRKVLGAEVGHLALSFSSTTIVLLLAAIVISVPLAYVLADQWLMNFAFHAPLELSAFIWGSGLVFLIAVLTVLVQSLRAAVVNPIHAIRGE